MLVRIISAFGGLALLLGTLYFFGNLGLTIVGSLVVLIAAYEYSSLFERSLSWLLIFLGIDTIIYTTCVFKHDWTLAVSLASFVSLITCGIFLFHKQEPKEILAKLQWALWGILYTALLPALSVQLLYEKGWPILMFLLVTVFFGDIFAYFCGLTFGGKKILPLISPKKTISGCIGGLLGSALCGTLFLMVYSRLDNIFISVGVCLCVGFFAQLGDFFESLIKRVAGKKDTSRLMPGHGGFLDRLDGVYFGSATLYFFCTVFDFIQYF